jgi:hypothetical protein
MEKLLWILPALACPAVMGAMMWVMMCPGRQQSPPGGPQEQELTQLRAEIDELRTQQRDRAVPADVPTSTP